MSVEISFDLYAVRPNLDIPFYDTTAFDDYLEENYYKTGKMIGFPATEIEGGFIQKKRIEFVTLDDWAEFLQDPIFYKFSADRAVYEESNGILRSREEVNDFTTDV
jgi:hypothetical protein